MYETFRKSDRACCAGALHLHRAAAHQGVAMSRARGGKPRHAPDPIRLALAYFDALHQGDAERMAGFLHADTLTEFHALICTFLRDEADEGPDADGEYAVRAKLAGDGLTLEEALAVSPLRMWSRVLAPVISAGAFLDPPEILGEVLEGDHIIHVLTRISCRQASTGKPRWKS